jgi:hypothetical protein
MSVITDFIEKLTKEGADGNFLIINFLRGTYMQFAADKGSNKIYCETSGKYYDIGEALSSTQIAQLNELGWDLASAGFEGNYGLNVHLKEDYPLSHLEEMIHATAKIYGASEDIYTYELVLE